MVGSRAQMQMCTSLWSILETRARRSCGSQAIVNPLQSYSSVVRSVSSLHHPNPASMPSTLKVLRWRDIVDLSLAGHALPFYSLAG